MVTRNVAPTRTAQELQPSFRDHLFDGMIRCVGRAATKSLFKAYDLAKFQILGIPQHGFGSIDITYRCNLACRHCYFLEQGYRRELTDEQWMEKFAQLRNEGFPFYQCSWVGGEPLLRKDFIGTAMKYFKSNVVATNGTIQLPDWPDVNFYVSVDGTQHYYKLMRGKEKVYPLIKDNADRPDLRVIVSMVVSKINYECIKDLIEEWSKVRIKGIMFQFYTPIRGHVDDLWLGWELRDKILDELIELKKIYGDFIILPEGVFRLMKSDVCREVTSACLYAGRAFCFDPEGKVKKPCMMGEKADCSRCGCVLPFHFWLYEGKSFFDRLRTALK